MMELPPLPEPDGSAEVATGEPNTYTEIPAWSEARVRSYAASAVAAERERRLKLEAWLQWCLDNCDDTPEWNFGTAATEHMRALLAGGDAPMPDGSSPAP